MQDEERRFYERLNALTELIVDNEGFQKLADFISDMYDSPVSIIDNAYTVIAFSQHRLPSDPVIAKELRTGHLGLRPSSMMQTEESTGPRHRVTSTVRIDIPQSTPPLRNYLTRIYIHHVSVASFSIFVEGEPLSPVAEAFLPRIGTILALELQKSSFFALNKARYFTHLLSNILDTTAAESLVDIKERFSLFGHTVKPYMRVALVDVENALFAEDELRTLSATMHEALPNNVYVVRDSSIMFLVSQDADAPMENSAVEQIEQMLKETNARMGISGVYTAIEQTQKRLEQAQSAIDTARALPSAPIIARFDELAICDLLQHASQATNIRLYGYPPFLKLMDFDSAHGTELTKTLVAYLRNPHEQLQACAALHIHRNTLYYRLKQIREIMGVDIEDGRIVAKVFITIAIEGIARNSWDFVEPF